MRESPINIIHNNFYFAANMLDCAYEIFSKIDIQCSMFLAQNSNIFVFFVSPYLAHDVNKNWPQMLYSRLFSAFYCECRM